ncbi:sulfotransferase [Pacificimonas sp. ICDLI1SI03]
MSEAGRELYEAAVACERAGDMAGAFEAFRDAAKADENVAAPYVGLARILTRNHQRVDAIACLWRASACEPRNVSVWNALGQTLASEGRLDEAEQAYRRALDLQPEALVPALRLAQLYEDKGDRRAAKEAYERLLRGHADEAEGLVGLLAVAEGASLASAIESARRRIAKVDERDAALIGYALGKALARSGEHEAAFAAWRAANQARQRQAGLFDRNGFDRRIDRLIELFSSEFFAAREGWGTASERPVFIVGLPRSGTTLTEQVLASHPLIHGAGELDVLTDMATGTPDRLGGNELSWPETAPHLSREHVDAIGADYLQRLAAVSDPGAAHVVDKQPLNFWHLGLVALALPGARIIHCTRDVRDNGLSIYVENFALDQRWATDLDDIAHYWRGYRRLMGHWQEVLGPRMVEARYEDMIDGLEPQSRALLDFLDVEWDERVLSFHNSKRAVQTPSRWQVRRPIYASSQGRWRRYAANLQPLIDVAEPGKQ